MTYEVDSKEDIYITTPPDNKDTLEARLDRIEQKLDAVLDAFQKIGDEVGGAMSQLAEGGLGGIVKGLMGRD